jgi:hypothetical protein
MNELLEAYRRDARKSGFLPRSGHFLRLFSQYQKIKFLRFDRYLCPKCFQSRHESKDFGIEKHRTLFPIQRKAFLQGFATLTSRKCLIVQDYSTIHEETSSKIRVLNLTMITVEGKENELQEKIEYFDLIGIFPPIILHSILLGKVS